MQAVSSEIPKEEMALNAANAFVSIFRNQGWSDKEISDTMNSVFSHDGVFDNKDWYKSVEQ